MAAEAIGIGYAANVASATTAVIASMLWARRPSARLDKMQMSIEVGIKQVYVVSHLIPERERVMLSTTYLQ
jgi:hypothetical protein